MIQSQALRTYEIINCKQLCLLMYTEKTDYVCPSKIY